MFHQSEVKVARQVNVYREKFLFVKLTSIVARFSLAVIETQLLTLEISPSQTNAYGHLNDLYYETRDISRVSFY